MAKDYSAIYPILNNWDVHLGGIPPGSEQIEDAHQCGYKEGANHTLALALGFRSGGSTRAERRYAGKGDPKDNIGALGDLIRAQYGSARIASGRSVSLTTKTGMHIQATTYGKGRWKFELIDQDATELIQLKGDYENRLKNIQRTERDVTTKQRCGQDVLREFLLKRDQGCAVTGLEVPELLRASHIRPWSDPNEKDRLNPNNAVLLAAHLDAAFDSHLISFNEQGRIMISTLLDQKTRRLLGLSSEMKLKDHARHEIFMSEHRAVLKPTLPNRR